MGATVLDFKPRESLSDFVANKMKVSLIRRTGGRKSSKNMLVHGENLAALAALKAGFGTAKDNFKVEVIEIDPPYNVGGNQGYRNNWKGQSEKERDWAGDHGAFLDFMEPRLKIARQLLTDDGIIFIHICDGEYARLKILMNQIFGEENEVATFIWDKLQGAGGSHAVSTHEYVLCFAKNKKLAPSLEQEKPSARLMIEVSKKLIKEHGSIATAQPYFTRWVNENKKAGILKGGEAQYNRLHPKNGRVYTTDNTCAHDDPNGTRCRKVLIHPLTKKPCPVPANGWKWKEETLDQLVTEGKISFGEDHNSVPRIIRFLDEHMSELPQTVIRMASNGKDDLPDGIEFATPKPVKLIKYLLSLYPKKNLKVLDFFAGSGATAHAVLQLNKEDGGERSWIMIEEMKSTFNKVLLPRIQGCDSEENFSTYEVETVPVGGKELLKKFSQHSYDFLSSYHVISEEEAILVEGLNVLGIDKRKNQLIAITVPSERTKKTAFIEELAALKQTLRKVNAKSILIYTLHGDTEEPWLGVDKSVFSGTSCKELQTVGVPDELVREWNEVLQAMAA